MIAYLNGTVTEIDEEKCTIEVNGVGYLVYSSRKTLGELRERAGSNPRDHAADGLECPPHAKLFTKLIHRDEAMDLYGFLTRQELAIFTLLITVSGIGPRNAIKILGTSEVTDIAKAVVSENSSFLRSIAGIGEKKAQQIILALKEKMKKIFQLTAASVSSGHVEAVSLLESLGFSRAEAGEAVEKAKALARDGDDVERLVEEALKQLSGRA